MKDNIKIIQFLNIEVDKESCKYKFPHFIAKDVLNPLTKFGDYHEWADRYEDESKEYPFNIGYLLSENSFLFDKSFDWLMVVADKIDSLGFSTYCKNRGTTIQDNDENIVAIGLEGKNRLENLYIAILDFIEYFNNSLTQKTK